MNKVPAPDPYASLVILVRGGFVWAQPENILADAILQAVIAGRGESE